MEENKEFLEDKKNNSNPWIIITIILTILVLGLVGYISYDKFYLEKKIKGENTTEKTDTKKEKEEKLNVPDELSERLKYFMTWGEADGTDMLSITRYRVIYIGMELDNIRKTTNDPGRQEVGYIEYDIFKEKYEEIYGNNYNLDLDLKESGQMEECDGFPSIANQKNVCWSINYGVFGGEYEYIIESRQRDKDLYIVEGTRKETFPDGEQRNNKFKIVYTIKDNTGYLKSIMITTDE